jgi:DNA-binding MarR family transcriptional regulator
MPNVTDSSAHRPKGLERDRYLPGYVVRLANALSRGGSRVYLKLFGVGVVEWRILSMLAIEPALMAQEIAEALETDKSSVSRSVQTLERMNLLTVTPHPQNSRIRLLTLTPEGMNLHDQLLVLALAREARVLKGFSSAETATLLEMLKRLTANLNELGRYEEDLWHGRVDPPQPPPCSDRD